MKQDLQDNKKEVIILVVLIILFFGLSVFYFSFLKNGVKDEQELDEVKNQKEIMELMQSNRKTINDAEKYQIKPVRAIDESDHILGDINAPVQLIVYSDFTNVFCGQYYNTLKKVAEEYPDDVVIAYRHFPWVSNPYALTTALAAECAAEQGKFWETYDKLFAANLAENINEEQVVADAEKIGLDIDSFNSCLSEQKYKNKIQESLEEARSYGVAGPPQSFINGRFLTGAYQFEDFVGSDGENRNGLKKIIEEYLHPEIKSF